MPDPVEAPKSPEPPDDLAEGFLRFLDGERRSSPRTLDLYETALRQFRQWRPPFKGWDKLESDDFRAFLFDLMKQERARSTIRLQFAALRSFYKWLTRRHGWKHNPLLDVQLPKLEKKLPVIFTVAQIEHLLALPLSTPKTKQALPWAGERDAAILELFYSTGMRLSELAGMNVEDIDPISEVARVFGKGRKERLCPLVPAEGGRACRASFPQPRAPPPHHAGRGRCGAEILAAVRARRAHDATQIPPQLRHASFKQRRGPPQRADAPRPRQPLDHADLHARLHAADEGGL